MTEDQTRFERLEKAHLELQEKYTKSSDDISQMMEMLKMLTWEKQSAETPNPQTKTTPLKGTGEDILYPQGFVLPRETSATYALASQPFPFNYGPSQVVNTLGLVIREPKTGTKPVDPLVVLNLDELEKRERHLRIKL